MKFPVEGVMPKVETQASSFIQKNSTYDGRGIIMGVFDTGCCVGATGLQKTTTGLPKIIDAIDATGSGDVDMTTIVKGKEIVLLTGRTIQVPENWKSENGEFRIGIKRAFELYPAELVSKCKSKKKEEFLIDHQKNISTLKSLNTKESNAQVEGLEQLVSGFEYAGPALDVIAFNDGKDWNVVVFPTCESDISKCKVLKDYKISQDYSMFSEETMLTYSVKIYKNCEIVSIVVVAGAHGTHVAGIIGANYPDQPEINGVAPGIQIVSIKIGDTRMGTMETGEGLIRGLLAAKECGCHIINMSYGEYSSVPNRGRFVKLVEELVMEHNVVFVSSGGNNGPALSTVGAPGGTTDDVVVGVGAYVSPVMQKVEYSLRENMDEFSFLWSSRGPCVDGALGIDIIAPGGAIATIPTYLLSKNAAMHGTSMSSPNAAGCISLLLSGMKQEGLAWHPYNIIRAIQNTAIPIKSEPLAYGRGLIQVCSAFDYLKKHFYKSKEPIRYNINCEKKRGIYLRGYEETHADYELQVFINTEFHKQTKNIEKIDFDRQIIFLNTAKWVKCPEFMMLSNDPNHNRGMNVKILCSDLPDDSVHFTEILAIDATDPDAGALFRIPVTVVKPAQMTSFKSEAIHEMIPGNLVRKFIQVPAYAKYVDVVVTGLEIDTYRQYVVHGVQIVPHVSFKETTLEKWIKLVNGQSQSLKMRVVPNVTLELVVGQNWTSMGNSSIKVEIEFHGLMTSFGTQLQLNERVTRVNLSTPLRSEDLALKLALTTLHLQIVPQSSQIRINNDTRNQLFDGRYIHELILNYSFTLTESSDVITRLTSISDILYESNYESQLVSVYNSNKQLVHTGDAWPKKIKLIKDSYTLVVSIRHHTIKKLDRLKNLVLNLEIGIKEIPIDVYPSMISALEENGKISNLALKKGDTETIFIRAIKRRNLPKHAKYGDLLVGTIKYSNSSLDDPIVLKVPPPKFVAPKPTPFKFDEKIVDHLVHTLEKCEKEEFEKNIEKALTDHSTHIPLLFTSLRFETDFVKIQKVSQAIIDLIDQNELAIYIGTKGKDNTKLDNHKKWLVDAYMKLLDALINLKESEDLIQKNLTELHKWVDAESEKVVGLEMRGHYINKQYGDFLKLYNKQSGVANKKNYLLLLQIFNENDWRYLAQSYGEEKFKLFPNHK
jgi:tripeptidyl-peptidase-2